MKKKFLLLLLAAMLGLAACTGGTAENGGENPTVAAGAMFDEELTGEITVYAFESMLQGEFLEEAARMFMDSNPGTVVNVSTFSSMPEIRRAEGAGGAQMMIAQAGDRSAERRDYVNMINTELMSGRGPDVMAIDALPFGEFAARGQLLDLLPFMEGDPNFDIAAYRANILDAAGADTGLFFFPLDYDFRYLTYDSSLLLADAQQEIASREIFTFDELFELGGASFAEFNTPDEHIPILGMFPGVQGGLFTELFRQNQHYFIDRTMGEANFDSGSFAQMLEDIIAHEEAGYILPMPDFAELAANAGGSGRERLLNQRSIFAPRQSMRLINEFMDESARQGGMRVTGGAMGAGSEYDRIAGIMGADAAVPFSVNMGLGINSNSQNPRLAWEFIRFASSDAMLQTMRTMGLPTYIPALEERAAFSLEGQPLADYLRQVEDFTAMLNSFDNTDAILEDIVRAEVETFFDGQISAEETASRLQSRIGIMLSE